MGAGGYVFPVHQNARRPQPQNTGRALGVLAVPLGPHGRDLTLATRSGEYFTREVDVGTARIVDEVDLQTEGQLRLRGGESSYRSAP